MNLLGETDAVKPRAAKARRPAAEARAMGADDRIFVLPDSNSISGTA